MHTLQTDAKINGELFLDLPNDEELLKGVELSRAFRKLVGRKAKEVYTCSLKARRLLHPQFHIFQYPVFTYS